MIGFGKHDLFSGELERLIPGGAISEVGKEAIWELPGRLRGKVIEWIASKTDYKDWKFIGTFAEGSQPTVDFEKGVAMVSFKTFDRAAGNSFNSGIKDLKSNIKALASDWLNMAGEDIKIRIFDVRVPTETMRSQVEAALREFAAEKHVLLEVKVF